MAGFCATVLSNPFDVVATRLMAGKSQSTSPAARVARAEEATLLGVVARLWQQEGLAGFYRGFLPNSTRIGSFNVCMWLAYEQIKRVTW